MKLIKRYILIIVIVLPVLVLILIRSVSDGSFKNSARKWAEPSMRKLNIIREAELETLQGDKLVIRLVVNKNTTKPMTPSEICMPSDSVISTRYLSLIKDHKGPVILSSSDTALAARIWMLISQTGCKNIYILAGNTDNETFKHEFRSDSIAGPEL